MDKIIKCPLWLKRIAVLAIRYTLWILFLIVLLFLLTGMSGVLGKKVKRISVDLSKKFGKNGTIKMVRLSILIGLILKLAIIIKILTIIYKKICNLF